MEGAGADGRELTFFQTFECVKIRDITELAEVLVIRAEGESDQLLPGRGLFVVIRVEIFFFDTEAPADRYLRIEPEFLRLRDEADSADEGYFRILGRELAEERTLAGERFQLGDYRVDSLLFLYEAKGVKGDDDHENDRDGAGEYITRAHRKVCQEVQMDFGFGAGLGTSSNNLRSRLLNRASWRVMIFDS